MDAGKSLSSITEWMNDKINKIILYEDIEDKELVKFFSRADDPILRLYEKDKNYMFLLGEKGFITIQYYGN
jgi:hypothetical protein